MSSTTCDICFKDFKKPFRLRRHKEKLSVCNPSFMSREQEREQKPSRTLTDPHGPSRTLTSVNYSNLSEGKNCIYCNIYIPHTKNYKRHLRLGCDKIPENIKKNLIKKYNKNKNHLNNLEDENNLEEEVKNINSFNSKNNNTTSNTNNNISNSNSNNVNINSNNNTKNTVNNNINTNITNTNTFHINPMGKEDISKLSYLKKKEIVKSGKGMFKNMMNAVLDLTENMNFYILNRKEKIAVFLNKEKELEAENMKLVLQEGVLNYYNMIYDVYTELEDELTDKEKQEHNIAYNKMEPITENKLLEDTVFFKLVSISKKCKNALDKYMKILEERESLLLEQ